MSHRCPGPECSANVPDDVLACRVHWYQVPRPIRNAVYRAWKRGEGAGSSEHRQAMALAIKKMRKL